MGRPSNLSEEKWNELLRRLTAGEKAADLAREYGVSKSAVSKRVAKPAENVKAVVNQMLAAELALKTLPVSQRIIAVDLIDELRQLSMSTVQVAALGMRTAHRLAAIANEEVQKVGDADPLKSAVSMKTVEWLGEIVRTHASVGLNLLAANKEAFRPSGGGEDDGADFIVEGGLPR